jgi:hypothetical protein
VNAAASPAEMGLLIAVLEGNVNWEAVEEKWRGRRASWVVEVRSATNAAQNAALLLELEAATKWSAVAPAWKDQRATWVANLQRIMEGR